MSKRLFKQDEFKVDGGKNFSLGKRPNAVKSVYKDKKDYEKKLRALTEAIDERQRMMYAHDRYAVLCIFQAMDAAGKDSTIRAVFSGVNPHGLQLNAFKKPSDNELDHGFLWRTNKVMPERGRIGVFNRSYYEEVLVVKVHPEILTRYQRLPAENTKDLKKVWKQRYDAINEFEKYANANGTRVLKFFLNVSNEEQRQRFLSRIDEPEKNWKFSEADCEERGYWKDYMAAYEDCIQTTATKHAPWQVIPADDKRNMRLAVAQVVLDTLEDMEVGYPEVDDDRKKELLVIRESLVG